MEDKDRIRELEAQVAKLKQQLEEYVDKGDISKDKKGEIIGVSFSNPSAGLSGHIVVSWTKAEMVDALRMATRGDITEIEENEILKILTDRRIEK